jgi:hypothetical protein
MKNMKLILESWRNYVAEEKEKKCPKCGKSPCVCPKKEEVNEEDLSLKDAVDAEEEGESDRVEMEEEKIKNPGKYMGGDRQQAGVDDDGDGIPNKADKNPKDGSKK